MPVSVRSFAVPCLFLATGLPSQSLLGDPALDDFVGLSEPERIYAAVVCDFDGDGRDDLLCQAYPGLVLHRNYGGQFLRETLVPVQGPLITAMDIDGDGMLDVVTQDQYNPWLRFYWGDGSNQPGNYPTWNQYVGVQFQAPEYAFSDVDHDGDIDFVICGTPGIANTTALLRNAGNRTFAAATTAEFPHLESGDARPVFFDIDGDTFDDLLVISIDDTSRLYWNDGGNFVEATPAQFPPSVRSLSCAAFADCNGDGALDILLGGGNGPGEVWLNVGPRQFALHPAGGLDLPNVLTMIPGDDDGDGHVDLSVFQGGVGHHYRNDGSGSFHAVGTFGGSINTMMVREIDLDDDDDLDLLRIGAATSISTGSTLAYSLASRPGAFDHKGDPRLPSGVSTFVDQFGDVEGDGLPDLVMSLNVIGSTVTVIASCKGEGVLVSTPAPNILPLKCGFADMEGDGKDGLMVLGYNDRYFPNTTGEIEATPLPLGMVDEVVAGVAVDVDGDGADELVLATRVGNTAVMHCLALRGGVIVDETAARFGSIVVPVSAFSVMAADLNGDGFDDVWVTDFSHRMFLWSQGDGTYVADATPQNLNGGRQDIGDVDGDGDLDLLKGSRLALNNGDGTFVDISAQIPQVLGNSTLRRIVDLDEDGDMDLLGNVVMWNDGAENFTVDTASLAPILPFSLTNDNITVMTDVDRDGDEDFFAFIAGKYSLRPNLLRQLELVGRPALGSTLDLRVTARSGQTPIATASWIALSFARIDPVETPIGWLQLDPLQASIVGGAVIPASGGSYVHHEPIPNEPLLLGVFVAAQAVELRGSRITLGNVVDAHLGW